MRDIDHANPLGFIRSIGQPRGRHNRRVIGTVGRVVGVLNALHWERSRTVINHLLTIGARQVKVRNPEANSALDSTSNKSVDYGRDVGSAHVDKRRTLTLALGLLIVRERCLGPPRALGGCSGP